jgi:predicted TIM-barrel fold metal-dependent hydrolase
MREDRSVEGVQRWREGMRALADCSNVNVKLSGLGTFDHAYRLEVVAPIIADAVAMFGADRCLYGSNFPIEKLWTDYASLYRTFREAIEPFTEIEQQKILHDTAKRLYRL